MSPFASLTRLPKAWSANEVQVNPLDCSQEQHVKLVLGIMPRTLELHGLLGTLPDILAQATSSKAMKFYTPPNLEPFKEYHFMETREPTPSVPIVRLS